MAARDAATVAAKWGTNLQGAQDTMKAGAEAVAVAPGLAAARQKSLYVQNVTANADKFAKNVAAVSREDWIAAYTGKGLQRIASGVQSGQAKVQRFLGQFLPFQENAVKTLPARGNLEQNIARSAAMIRATSKFSYDRSAS